MSEEIQALTETAKSVSIASADQEFGLVDIGVVAVIIVLAVIYLYRSFWLKRGTCPGCGSKDGKCHLKPPAAQEERINVDALKGKSASEQCKRD